MKIESSEFTKSAAGSESFIFDGLPEIAFAGRSNVGKSSLLNKLLGRKLARTSSTPGRTQLVNYFRVNGSFYFVDLPGFGYAKASKAARSQWAEIINDYLRTPHPQRVVVHLVDGRVGATALDEQAGDYFASLGLQTMAVATKVDDVKRGERVRRMKQIAGALKIGEPTAVLAVSAQTGEGVRELWKSIAEFLAG
ncbi:MAG: ribosome biogenesis GTP-binding protein YihA/YsxC [Thermoanaerobaculia bacterium]